MLTLEQAIQHCKDKAKELRIKAEQNRYMAREKEIAEDTGTVCKYFHSAEEFKKIEADCLECADEHEQLAEWLTELKERREAQEHDFCQECVYENTQVCKKCNILKPNMFKPKENEK